MRFLCEVWGTFIVDNKRGKTVYHKTGPKAPVDDLYSQPPQLSLDKVTLVTQQIMNCFTSRRNSPVVLRSIERTGRRVFITPINSP